MRQFRKSLIVGPLAAALIVGVCLFVVWSPSRRDLSERDIPGSTPHQDLPSSDKDSTQRSAPENPGGGPGQKPKTGEQGLEASDTTKEPVGSPAEATADLIDATPADRKLPAGYEGFTDWASDEQVDKITRDLMNPNLPTEVVSLYREFMKNSRLGDLVRNNMAEALHNQEEKSPHLHEVLIASIDNEDEPLSWRVAAIQHLAKTYPYTAEPQKVLQKLEDLADTGKEPLGSQAMVMLDGLEQSGQIKAAHINLAIRRRLENASYETASRVSALNLVARRGMKDQIDLVRQLAAKDSAVQSAAVAALGKIGDRSDLPLIARFTNAGNALLASAAKTAVKSIEQRTAK